VLAAVTSCAVIGLEGALVEVEVDISRGLPSLTIVGLPDAAINESRERVRAAIKNSGLRWPDGRLTVNLAPADLRKEGPAYDLPIAVGVLVASEQAWTDALENALFVGELSLDGSVRHTTGILPMAAMAGDHGIKRLFVPAADAPEAALIEGLEVIPVRTLSELVGHLQGLTEIAPFRIEFDPEDDELGTYSTDFAEIKGQEHVKRALEVAASGGTQCPDGRPPWCGQDVAGSVVAFDSAAHDGERVARGHEDLQRG